MSDPTSKSSPQIRHVIGVMTGTSIDGIDAALVRIEGRALAMRATLIRHVSQPLGDLRLRLRQAAEQKPMTAGEFARLAWDFGAYHVLAIRELLEADQDIDLICAHGQTIFHQPPHSWQLLNPAPIAAAFDSPVVFDLRQADLAVGGQGAPITPIADWILFRDAQNSRAIVNLGGFCNVTILPRADQAPRAGPSSPPSLIQDLAQIKGCDVCACNQLLDAVAREVLNQPYDLNGTAARSGKANDEATKELLANLERQRTQGRSLGTGDEALQWLRTHAVQVAPNDLAASAAHAVGQCIGRTLNDAKVDEAIIAGGGVKNLALLEAMRAHCQFPLRLSDDLGVPAHAREAMCFAILGALGADGVAITLPQVTGCRRPAPISGAWSSSGRATQAP